MFLYVFFFNYLNTVLARNYTLNTFLANESLNYDIENEFPILRFLREDKQKPQPPPEAPICTQMIDTSRHPFVAVLLHKSPGNFLGMGSIVGRKAVLTAACVVEDAMSKPEEILVLAGTRGTWWSKNAQVRNVKEVFVHNHNVAVVTLARGFLYSTNVQSIKVSSKVIKDPAQFSEVFDKNWAVFGVPKGSYESPGGPTPKSTLYIAKIETESPKKPQMDACRALFRDAEFDPEIITCTYANGSFHWGCCGSPVVAVTPEDTLEQIAVLFKASHIEEDTYHMIVKTYVFNNWIRSVGEVPFDDK